VTTDVLLPLAVFFALGVPIVVLMWRVFVVGGELRRHAQYGRAAVDLARRADVSLAELATVVDDLRRRKAGPDESAARLDACAEALRRYAGEADAVDTHLPEPNGAGMRIEIERAQRAVELIEHGRQLMLEPATESIAEGETTVKRGYLNLMHARDAIRARGGELAAAATAPRPVEPRGRARSR
jgi:hypothetical protein